MQSLLSRLRALLGGAPAAVPAPDQPPELATSGDPKWLAIARADLGIRELPGPAANPAIMRAWAHVD